ncbi:hypothetical protein C8J57DRAFT_1671276 [Mycena rebaudengoi]|nr:hypothetical protein C8J57DRAFT_1671276 [Mycena rebaudengoi]
MSFSSFNNMIKAPRFTDRTNNVDAPNNAWLEAYLHTTERGELDCNAYVTNAIQGRRAPAVNAEWVLNQLRTGSIPAGLVITHDLHAGSVALPHATSKENTPACKHIGFERATRRDATGDQPHTFIMNHAPPAHRPTDAYIWPTIPRSTPPRVTWFDNSSSQRVPPHPQCAREHWLSQHSTDLEIPAEFAVFDPSEDDDAFVRICSPTPSAHEFEPTSQAVDGCPSPKLLSPEKALPPSLPPVAAPLSWEPYGLCSIRDRTPLDPLPIKHYGPYIACGRLDVLAELRAPDEDEFGQTYISVAHFGTTIGPDPVPFPTPAERVLAATEPATAKLERRKPVFSLPTPEELRQAAEAQERRRLEIEALMPPSSVEDEESGELDEAYEEDAESEDNYSVSASVVAEFAWLDEFWRLVALMRL